MKNKTRSFRRIVLRTLIAAAILLAILRITLIFVLPAVLDKTAASFDLTCTYERMDLSFFTVDMELWHLQVAPREGGDPLLHSEYLRADLSVLDLFLGDIVVRRVEADGLDIGIVRNADGTIPLFERFAGEGPEEEEEEEPAAVEPSTGVIPTLAFELNALRLQHVQTQFIDLSVSPPIDTRFDLNLRLSDLGSDVRKTRLQLSASSPPILDTFTVEGRGSMEDGEPRLDLEARLAGLHPRALAGYLEKAGIEARTERLDLSLQARASARRISSQEDKIEVYSAVVDVEKIVAKADDSPVFRLDRIHGTIDSLKPESLEIKEILVQGGRVDAAINQKGGFEAFGLLFKGEAGERVEEPTPEKEETSPSDFSLALENVVVKEIEAGFVDRSTKPETRLALVLKQLALTDCLSNGKKPMGIEGSLALPGVMETVALKGEAAFFDKPQTADLELDAQSITLEALAPYLADAGMESKLKDGRFHLRLHALLDPAEDGTAKSEVSLDSIRLSDGEDLFTLDNINVSALGMDHAKNRIEDVKITISEPRCAIGRSPSGDLELLGLCFKQAPPKTETIKEKAAPLPPQSSSSPPLSCLVSRVLLEKARIDWIDESVQPPLCLNLAEAGLDLSNLLIDLDATTKDRPMADLDLRIKAPGLIDTFSIQGRLHPLPLAPSMEMEIRGQGFTAGTAAPILEGSGLLPSLKNGELNLHLAADLVMEPEGVTANLAVTDLAYTDQGEELLALKALRVKGCETRPSSVHIASVEIDGPRARVERTPDGLLKAGGFCFIPSPPAKEAEPAPSGPAPVFSLDQFLLQNAALSFVDKALDTSTRLTLKAQAKDLGLGGETKPASLDLTLGLDNSLDSLRLMGEWTLGPQEMDGGLTLTAEGLRAGPLAPYLPEGIDVLLKDGRFRAEIGAGFKPHEEGGVKAHLEISDLDFRDGPDGPPLLKIDGILAKAARIDGEQGVFDMEEVSLKGTALFAQKTADQGMRLLGLCLHPAKGMKKTVPESPAPRKTSAALHHVSLDRLDLEVQSFVLMDESRKEAEPLTLSDFTIRNKTPIALLGEEPETQPPVEIAISGGLSPLMDRFSLDLKALPFAPEPELTLEVQASGLSGRGLVETIPGLKEKMDGSGLTHGELGARLETMLKLKKRHPLDFDLNRGFGFFFSLKDLALLQDGAVLAGLDELNVDGARVDPVKGDVFLKSVDLVNPKGRVTRTAQGIHVMGLTLLPGAAEEKEAASTTAEKAPAPIGPEPEFRVDKLYLSRIDFTYTDEATTPPMPLPLTGLDLEVRDFTTRIFREPLPLRFSLYLNAGEVALRPRKKTSGLVGLLGDAIDVVAGGEEVKTEYRKLFEEISVTGSLELHPHPRGWVKAGIHALELADFEGPAREGGVTLKDGVLDSGVSLYFEDDGSLDTDADFTFVDLSLSEPDNGPISRFLKLPAPLDTVIFLLRDEDGAMKIPLDFHVAADGLSALQISRVAVSTLATLVANAVASSPFRVAGTLGDFLPFPEEEEEQGETMLTLAFEPGGTYLDQEARERLAGLAERLETEEDLKVTLRHSLGLKDVACVHRRANPSIEDCRDLAERLRQQKLDLMAQRDAEAARVRAGLATGTFGRVQAERDRLAAMDRQLGLTGTALDRVLELMRPGAERQALRRTREAAVKLAEARLDAVKELLGNEERIRVTRPRYTEPEGDAPGCVEIVIAGKKGS